MIAPHLGPFSTQKDGAIIPDNIVMPPLLSTVLLCFITLIPCLAPSIVVVVTVFSFFSFPVHIYTYHLFLTLPSIIFFWQCIFLSLSLSVLSVLIFYRRCNEITNCFFGRYQPIEFPFANLAL